jgi:hypothetical protein
VIDLDDTTRCPVAANCATCGSPTDLAVATAETPVGVLCLTLCDGCAAAGELHRLSSWSAACAAVGEHCAHLGFDVDDAAEAQQ